MIKCVLILSRVCCQMAAFLVTRTLRAKNNIIYQAIDYRFGSILSTELKLNIIAMLLKNKKQSKCDSLLTPIYYCMKICV